MAKARRFGGISAGISAGILCAPLVALGALPKDTNDAKDTNDGFAVSSSGEPPPSDLPNVSSIMTYDEIFAFPLDDGCTYGASIRGTIRPIVTGVNAGAKVEPDLSISAILNCRSGPTLKITERVAATGAMTKADLENLIARRATILREDGGKRCSYVPEISLAGEGLAGLGVTYLCQLPQH